MLLWKRLAVWKQVLLEGLINKQINVVTGGSLSCISWWTFFSLTSLTQWHLEMSYPLERDWLSLIVPGELKLSCSPALICAAAGFSPTRPQKGLKEQRNSSELEEVVSGICLGRDCESVRQKMLRHVDGSDANLPAVTGGEFKESRTLALWKAVLYNLSCLLLCFCGGQFLTSPRSEAQTTGSGFSIVYWIKGAEAGRWGLQRLLQNHTEKTKQSRQDPT